MSRPRLISTGSITEGGLISTGSITEGDLISTGSITEGLARVGGMTDDLRARVAEVLPGVRADLENLVRIPSVGADPTRHDEVRRSAAAVAALFEAEGFDTKTVEVDGGLPAVIARKPAPAGKPTVLLYAHHDVQPEGARETLGDRAVRADRARRPVVRARRRRRQGRDRCAPGCRARAR